MRSLHAVIVLCVLMARAPEPVIPPEQADSVRFALQHPGNSLALGAPDRATPGLEAGNSEDCP